MIKTKIPYYLCLLIFSILFLQSCKDDETTDSGKMVLTFAHYVDNAPLQIDTLKYTNAAGNHYMVTEVQYFVSDITLHMADGDDFLLDGTEGIHYVDNDISTTMTWNITKDIPAGLYNSVSFTFGIDSVKNQSNIFVNPPERDMFWPEVLGGGYHYMKMNGKWRNDTMSDNSMFMLHLGIGQICDNDTIIGFVHNAFRVDLPGSAFTINDKSTTEMQIIMNIENWFQNPYIFDLAVYGQNLMQNQEGMHMACMNGKEDVFSVGYIQ
jgi:hypothetical protein